MCVTLRSTPVSICTIAPLSEERHPLIWLRDDRRAAGDPSLAESANEFNSLRRWRSGSSRISSRWTRFGTGEGIRRCLSQGEAPVMLTRQGMGSARRGEYGGATACIHPGERAEPRATDRRSRPSSSRSARHRKSRPDAPWSNSGALVSGVTSWLGRVLTIPVAAAPRSLNRARNR
jgi:hypothetical protein